MKKFVLPAQITINHQRYVHHEVCRNVEYIGHRAVWESESSDMTSVGHCGLEELVPILKRTIGEEQEFWVASPTSKILKLTQTHFTFSTFPCLWWWEHISIGFGGKHLMFYSDFTVVTKGKNVPASHVFARFFAVTPKLLLRSWVSLSVRDWWHPTKFSFMMNYTDRKSSDSTSPGQHMMIIMFTTCFRRWWRPFLPWHLKTYHLLIIGMSNFDHHSYDHMIW